MYISASLQEKFLSDLIKTKQPIAIYLKNGKKYQGTLVNVTQDLFFVNTPLPQTLLRNQIKTILPVHTE
ncbi:MAG TPA: RNA chaperone Hfq [Gammaproteobacteria bacterium]|nr:RNA chaperone Hfq [Gammaproteobacteria bacterium]